MIILQFGAHVIRTLRWRVLLSEARPDPRFRDLFAALMIGYAINSIVPRGGEVGRVIALSKLSKTPKSSVFGSIIIERLMDLAMLGIIFPLATLLYRERLEILFPGIYRAVGILVIITIPGLLLVWFIGKNRKQTIDFIHKFMGRFCILGKKTAYQSAGNFLSGLAGFPQKGNTIYLIILTILIWFISLLSIWVLAYSFPFGDTLPMNFSIAILLALVIGIGSSLPSPGGAGTIHFFVSQTLSGLFAVSIAESLAYAIMIHATAVFFAVILGGTCGIWVTLTKKIIQAR